MSIRTSTVGIDEVRRTCLAALCAAGVPSNHAQTQVRLLLDAELRGVHSHGLLRLPRVIERVRNGVCDPHATGRGAWKGASRYEVDGCHGLGPVVACAALERLYDKVETSGVAVAAVRNCDHLGMLAWYAKQATNRGLILIALTVSEALVHPWGGRRAMVGTNPIAIGVPADPHPFILDMATSLVSMGKIHDHANRGLPIPLGWAVDGAGQPTTDAEAAKGGAIAPFGGAKGYGLGLGFELLVAGLTGCAIGTDVVGTLDSDQPCNKGDLFIVLKPLNDATKSISNYLQALRSSQPADPRSPVRVPGDRGREAQVSRERDEIDIDSTVWSQIEKLAKA
ncbi:Ldh family oxidoreductase [Allopusillimonas ginsengisoli]|uniref:Ldh family oxidoreductase n=1 Tax=Allopusillimonas ginsengisoli TaxID=453575 RepID=UPI00101F569C|nr:Ldh family oxidoreductase [Allopusillimonas ginsengisoli]TEA80012.1 Ldh family oxidoreductase [Allopusillimonas ginsengisoli]